MPSTALSRKYDAEQIETGLLAVAACGGNAERASRELKEREMLTVPSRTLRYWVRTLHTQRYYELVNEHGRKLEDLVVGQIRELVVAIGDAERLALAKTVEALQAGKIQDPARTLRNLSVSKVVNTDRMLVLSGRASEIVDHRNGEDQKNDIYRRMARTLPRGLFSDDFYEHYGPEADGIQPNPAAEAIDSTAEPEEDIEPAPVYVDPKAAIRALD